MAESFSSFSSQSNCHSLRRNCPKYSNYHPFSIAVILYHIISFISFIAFIQHYLICPHYWNTGSYPCIGAVYTVMSLQKSALEMKDLVSNESPSYRKYPQKKKPSVVSFLQEVPFWPFSFNSKGSSQLQCSLWGQLH